MKIIKRYYNEPPFISSVDILHKLIKDIFGTFFIEEKWIFSNGATIGRTFFADRQKKAAAINHTVTDNVQIVFQAALLGNSPYVPANISRRLAQFYQEVCTCNFDFLIFFGDETDEVLQRKLHSHLSLLSHIMIFCEDKEQLSYRDLEAAVDYIYPKMSHWFLAQCKGTYTEIVIQNINRNSQSEI